MTDQRCPLHWPRGWQRTPKGKRRHTRFHGNSTQSSQRPDGSWSHWKRKKDLSIADAIGRLSSEMRKLGVTSWLISSNVRVRNDGLPYSNDRPPEDVGIAVYFKRGGKDLVLACDAWLDVAGNIAAVAGHIDAIRAQERYAVGTLDQAFAGYAALPARGETWRATLGFGPDADVTSDAVDRQFSKLARERHPDVPGGSHDAMASLNEARSEAKRWLSDTRV